MKRLTIALLVAAQIVAGPPATAAELVSDDGVAARRQGTFAGARLRVPLGGAEGGKARAGLAVTRIQQSRLGDGRGRTAFSNGLEFGLSGDETVRLSVNGVPASRFAAGGKSPGGRKAGVSTVGWVAIGAGVAALAFVGWFVHEMNSCAEHDDEC